MIGRWNLPAKPATQGGGRVQIDGWAAAIEAEPRGARCPADRCRPATQQRLGHPAGVGGPGRVPGRCPRCRRPRTGPPRNRAHDRSALRRLRRTRLLDRRVPGPRRRAPETPRALAGVSRHPPEHVRDPPPLCLSVCPPITGIATGSCDRCGCKHGEAVLHWPGGPTGRMSGCSSETAGYRYPPDQRLGDPPGVGSDHGGCPEEPAHSCSPRRRTTMRWPARR